MNYKELFKPYTRDGHTLEASIAYLKKTAATSNIPKEVVEEAIYDIFSRVSKGEKFSLTKCPCGCGIDKAGTAIVHAMRDRMFEILYERIKIYYKTINKVQGEELQIEEDLFDLLNLIYEKVDTQKDREIRQIQFEQNRSSLRHPIKVGWPKLKNKLPEWPKIKTALTRQIKWI